jgi:hypothetical protein
VDTQETEQLATEILCAKFVDIKEFMTKVLLAKGIKPNSEEAKKFERFKNKLADLVIDAVEII